MIFEISLIAVMMLVLLMLAPGSGWTPNLALGHGPKFDPFRKGRDERASTRRQPCLTGIIE